MQSCPKAHLLPVWVCKGRGQARPDPAGGRGAPDGGSKLQQPACLCRSPGRGLLLVSGHWKVRVRTDMRGSQRASSTALRPFRIYVTQLRVRCSLLPVCRRGNGGSQSTVALGAASREGPEQEIDLGLPSAGAHLWTVITGCSEGQGETGKLVGVASRGRSSSRSCTWRGNPQGGGLLKCGACRGFHTGDTSRPLQTLPQGRREGWGM